MSVHNTSAAQQAFDSSSGIDCSSYSLGAASSSSSPSGVKKLCGPKTSTDHLQCPSPGADPESHPLQRHQQQQQQQHHGRRRKRKCNPVLISGMLVLCSLTTATLVFQVYHHMSQYASPKVWEQKEATAASTADPDARDSSTTAVPSPQSDTEQRMDWIHIAIDMLAVANCTSNSGSSSGTRATSMEPCKVNSMYITSDADALAPLRCVDDAFLERPSSQNHCTAESTGLAFQLLAYEGRIRVTKPGLYLMIGQVTARLREAAELHFGVTVNQQLPFLCTVQSQGTSSPGEDQPVPYSQCSVQGLRRLQAGDEVWLLVPHGNIPLQSLYRSTFLQLARLSP